MNKKLFSFRPFEITQVESCRKGFVPGPRSGHRICCDNNNLYVYGGYNFQEADESHNLYKEILRFNFVSKKWKLLNEHNEMEDDCPDELASASMLMYGKALVVFGGTSYPFGMRCSNTITLVSVNSSDSNKIQTLATGNDERNQPPGQYGMSVVAKDNFMYTLGGTQGFDYTADIYRLDFNTQNWELLATSRPEIDPDHPVGRYRHEIAIDDRYIYIFGGGTSDTVFDLKKLPAYDLVENKWKTVFTYPDPAKDYPRPRKCHSLVQHTTRDIYDNEETCVYIVGGTNNNTGPLRDIWKLSLKTLRWTLFRKSILSTTLFFHDACITADGSMYIFGGITTNNSRSNKLLRVWVTIPKLSAIAWEALIHYYPKMHLASKSYMLENGVPMHFASRVHP